MSAPPPWLTITIPLHLFRNVLINRPVANHPVSFELTLWPKSDSVFRVHSVYENYLLLFLLPAVVYDAVRRTCFCLRGVSWVGRASQPGLNISPELTTDLSGVYQASCPVSAGIGSSPSRPSKGWALIPNGWLNIDVVTHSIFYKIGNCISWELCSHTNTGLALLCWLLSCVDSCFNIQYYSQSPWIIQCLPVSSPHIYLQ